MVHFLTNKNLIPSVKAKRMSAKRLLLASNHLQKICGGEQYTLQITFETSLVKNFQGD